MGKIVQTSMLRVDGTPGNVNFELGECRLAWVWVEFYISSFDTGSSGANPFDRLIGPLLKSWLLFSSLEVV